MYKIDFYSDQNGKEPVLEYLEELASKKDKDSRIKLNKIRDYMKIYSENMEQELESHLLNI
jgi:phage-related protein